MGYVKFKDLAKTTQSDQVWREKNFGIASNPKNDGQQRELASMVLKFFHKKSTVSGIKIDLCSKYPWVFPLKDKKGVSIINAFPKVLDNSKRKPNKIWLDRGSEFWNSQFKKFLKDNKIEMYWAYNEGKSVVAERFVKTLENMIYKHMAAVSRNFYFDLLDGIVYKYNNAFHRTDEIKPIEVKSNSYAEYSVCF